MRVALTFHGRFVRMAIVLRTFFSRGELNHGQ